MNSRRLIDDRSHPATRSAYATRPGARNPGVVLASSVCISGRAYQVAALCISSAQGHRCSNASHRARPALLRGHRARGTPWLRSEWRPGRETDLLFGSLATLIDFLVLAGIAVAYRRRKEIHKRFMLFANISPMGAPITYFLGYFGLSSAFTVLGGLALFFLFAVAGDCFRAGRVIRLRRRSLSSVFCSCPFKPS
jgi:hypothetical protein